ncbi:SAM-dependent methyltransferase [Crossiella sp. CA198]|uniref:SAM-dependent methyltransferase n=1 Tax=Crossiella sp. CA198 TaxID=3455607 RepID=UPI003F8D12C3
MSTQIRLPVAVGFTGLMTAYNRAVETARPDALFTDPLAARFVEVAGDTTLAGLPRLGPAAEDGSSELWTGMNGYLAGRTVFYDRAIQAATAKDHGPRQVVLLGAGLDTRAFRLALPAGTVVYEVDTAEVHEFKSAVLAGHLPTTPRIPVPVDLREDWPRALRRAGFNPAWPTVWVAEGLLMYFPDEAANALLDTVTEQTAAGSTLLTEYMSRRPRMTDAVLTDPQDHALCELLVGNTVGGPDPDPATWLAEHGWTGAHLDLLDQLTALGRPHPTLFDRSIPEPLRAYLISGRH